MMVKRKAIRSKICHNSIKKGKGFLNTLINKLPIELHIPGYNYCGPGTKLAKRLARGDVGINPLDDGCKKHDIPYSQFNNTSTRNVADRELATVAAARVKASDAKLGEKLATFGVSNIMNMKSKLGMGLRKVRRKPKRGNNLKLKHGGNLKRKTLKSKHKKSKKMRIIPIPKSGGFLPFLLPLLGAIGAVGGGAAGIAKAVNDVKTNQKLLDEQKRHNMMMEQTPKGRGFYLNPYPYVKPKNFQ
ncbi:hypothetical protein NQ317_006781 [Molorchus minor]|uniref:Phospholipase A2-like domain-containing protein n=1 Tax=Molorchus minor TaxID=1323400 RepID=A0ABQ9IVQ4_9CUCU|nr:hypothetical protein NQ317_006781 [Molorchus minor]